jgi:hypothetical protein
MLDILFISIAAVLSGVESWDEMEEYGKKKLPWLETIFELPNGIPPHNTFNRLFAALDPNEFEDRFIKWVKSLCQSTDGEIIRIDAMGCQKTIAKQIVKKQADYVLSVKDNQQELLRLHRVNIR